MNFRAVIDTNIFISGIFFGGQPRRILDLIDKKIITPCFIISTYTELERLLFHKKFTKQRKFLSFDIYDFLNELKSKSLIFPQPSKIPKIVKEDPADNHFLACALISGADFIISGDKHLLSLKQFQGIPILSPKEFLKNYKKLLKRK